MERLVTHPREMGIRIGFGPHPINEYTDGK
jgi:hypothetical protein